MIALLKARQDVTATDLVTAITTAADAFASGANQHDDMTLIAMKVASPGQ